MIHVFVVDWARQSGGEDFTVGSQIFWGIAEGGWGDVDPLGDHRPVDLWFETHHLPTDQTVRGTVTSIQNVFFRSKAMFEGDPTLYPVASSAVLEPVARAEYWVPDRGVSGGGRLEFRGFLVEVDGVIRKGA